MCLSGRTIRGHGDVASCELQPGQIAGKPPVRETAGTGVEDFVSRPVKSISAVDITGRLAVVVDVYGVMFKCLQMWNHITCMFLSK